MEVGDVVGKLTVIRKYKTISKYEPNKFRTVLDVKCECGGTKTQVRADEITNRKVTRCDECPRPHQTPEYKMLIASRARAKKRNIPHTIKLSDLLFQKFVHY